MAGRGERPLSPRVVQTLLAQEQLREDRMQRWQVKVDNRRSQGMIGRKLEGSLAPTWLMVVVVRDRSDEEVEGGGLPCVAVACRKHWVHIRDEVGSPSGARSLDGQGAGNRDHSEDEVVVCAWDWEAPMRLGGVGSRNQVGHIWEVGGQRECNQENPWVRE
jgi:hypothetical protein